MVPVSVSVAPSQAVSTWSIDPSHSAVEFSVKHMVVTTTKGRFGAVAGAIVLDESDLTRSSVTAEIDAASIETHDAGRDAHLRSADFFDVENYPTLTFKSSRVVLAGRDRLTVVGDLTIRGVTREVELSVESSGQIASPFGDLRAGFSAQTSIDRKEFGLTWNKGLETGGLLVGDQVKINLEIEAIKQAS
jgi:polyisoprenoid-binding protein YceI